MIKVNKPWNPRGKCLMRYKGRNLMMQKSANEFTSQEVTLKKNVRIQNGIEERCCFEINFFNKKFLMAIDGFKFYEIASDENGDSIYIELMQSWFYADFFEDKNLFVIKGNIEYYNQLTPDYLLLERFLFQANFSNQSPLRDLFEGVNQNN